MKIAVIGSGGWGTAVSTLLDANGHDVYLWSWKKEESENLKRDKENKEFLPGVKLSDSITYTNDMALCAKNADIIVTASPSHAMRSTARALSQFVEENQIILNISKGIEPESGCRLSEIISQEIPQARIAVMSGPSHAEEVARKMATANVVASKYDGVAELVQDAFMNSYFRVYTSDDIIGVELGGSLKNVIALAAGIAVGLGCGDNTAAALMTRGIAEIARLGVKLGAKKETFAGLAGIGDLIVTCMSTHSRNRTCGVLIGQGMDAKSAMEKVHMVVEGYITCLAAHQLAKKCAVTMPITECTYRVLYENMPACDSILLLMQRGKKAEAESDYLSGK